MESTKTICSYTCLKDISYQNNDAHNGVVIEISLFHTTIILARVWSIIFENDTLRCIPGFNKSPLPVFIAGIGVAGPGRDNPDPNLE